MDICLSAARAAASRRNGAKSRGPRTPEGKARSSQNALKHGFRAQKFVCVGDEDPREFAALEAALLEESAPEGALQGVLAARIARAAWRLERAERIEAELFAREMGGPFGEGDLGLALIRDCNGARAFDTLLRYRGTTLAELWRALRLLKALQAERAERAEASEMPAAPAEPHRLPEPHEMPIEPEARTHPCETASAPAADRVVATVAPALTEEPQARCKKPIEPEPRGNSGETAPAPPQKRFRAHEATQKCVTAAQKCVAHAPSKRRSGAVHAAPSTNSA